MEVIRNLGDKAGLEFSHTRSDIISIDFHLHDAYEIYYLISGDVNYFVENKIYELKQGDVIITNKYEIHKPFFKSNKTYERAFIQFDDAIPVMYGSGAFDLLQCFNGRRKGERNKIEFDAVQRQEFLELMEKLEHTGKNKNPADEILRNTYFIQLLVLLNRAFLSSSGDAVEQKGISARLFPILDHINENLQGDLSLESIEQQFFINRHYLTRLFKKNTGMNLHQYVIYKRLARSKELLARGLSVTEACYSSGFNDYSNFYRLFKRIIGTAPGEYKKRNAY